MWDDEQKLGLINQIQDIEKDLDEWMKGLPSKGRTDFSSGMYGYNAGPWSTAQDLNQLKEIKKKTSDYKSLLMAGTILDDEGKDKGNILSMDDLTPYGQKFKSMYKKKLLFKRDEDNKLVRSEEPLLDVKDIVKNISGSQGNKGVRDYQEPDWSLAGPDLNHRRNSKLKSAIQERLWVDLNPMERMERLKNDKHLGLTTHYDHANIPYEIDNAEEMRIQDENENFMIERFAEKFPNEYLDFITNERESMQQYINENDPMGEGFGSWNERGKADRATDEPKSVISEKDYGREGYTSEKYHKDLYEEWKENRPVDTGDSTESSESGSNYDVQKASMVLSPDMKETFHASLDELGKRREELLSGLQFTLSNLEGFM